MTVREMATRYTLSALPVDHQEGMLRELTVEYRGDGRRAVCRRGDCLSFATEKWHREPQCSSRTERFLKAHRGSLDDALRLARKHAARSTVLGMGPAEFLERYPPRTTRRS